MVVVAALALAVVEGQLARAGGVAWLVMPVVVGLASEGRLGFRWISKFRNATQRVWCFGEFLIL
jgi:hypothetical protein